MKSFTDIEQSKKLAEILPPESADMCYVNDGTSIKVDANSYTVCYSMWKDCVVEIIPCWSLAALYSILPNNEDTSITLYHDCRDGLDEWFCEHDSRYTKVFGVRAGNPVDACVDMIITLKERNLL